MLKPGTFARVHIESGKIDDVLTLPYAALQYRYGVNRVFVVDGDKLAMRELAVGERLGDRIEVMSGVKAGERVAVTDVDTLADGAAVDRRRNRRSSRVLSELCVRRPVFATMLVMSLVVLGTFSFRGLGVDLFPKADPATVSVALSLPGASPDEMSTSVVEPMEEAISGVSGIDEIQARIAEGRGQITVRFVLERDLNDASNDVREKVASAIRNMPPELLPPVITKVDPDADPVMSLIVSSDAMSLRTLTELTDKQIARVIQTVNGVGEVSLAGGRAREIHIVVDIEKLNSYGLSMTEVRDALVAENVEIPGGTVEQGKGQLLLRTLGRVDASADFNDIVVATRNGTPIRVSDIGHAEDTFQRPTSARSGWARRRR